MHDQILVVVFVVLFITLLAVVFLKKDEEAKEGFDFIIGAALGEKKFQESNIKKIMAKGLQKAKHYNIGDPVVTSIIEILNPRFNYANNFDSITHDILDNKKKTIVTLNEGLEFIQHDYDVKWNLLTHVNTRLINTDNKTAMENLELTLKNLDKDICLYDKEVELISVFILNDVDDVLYAPFYNEDLTEQEIRVSIMKIMRAELSEFPKEIQDDYYEGKDGTNKVDLKIKNNTISKIKEMYSYKDKIFLNNIIRKYIVYE